MVVMDGLGSSWMENLLPCTPVEVLRVGRIVLKIEESSWRNSSELGHK
jgi:hypothetical protein